MSARAAARALAPALAALLGCAPALGGDSRPRPAAAAPAAGGPSAPAVEALPEAASAIAPPSPMPPRLLRTLAHDPAGYDPARAPVVNDLLLGDLLFHSPIILGAEARRLGMSCNTCHPNGAAHPTLALPGVSDRPGNVDLTTGHFRKGAENGIADAVNIPSLRGARFTGPYGRDGRTASLAEFIEGVVEGEFGGGALSPRRLAALVRYVQDLDFLPNPALDPGGRLRVERSSEAARRGEAIFLSKTFDGLPGGRCAACHPPDRFFRDGEVHRMRTGRSPSPYSIDDGYETPTLLGAMETAPYFHDGRFATLGEVVAWFDEAFALRLSLGDRGDLTAYLEAIGGAEKRVDDRSVAKVMVDAFVYLLLLTDGEARDDRQIWAAALAASAAALDGRAVPAELSGRIGRARARVAEIAARVARGEALAPMRAEVRAMHGELVRLAADWAGALQAAEGGTRGR